MMRGILYTSRFKKDVKRLARRSVDLSALKVVSALLVAGMNLPPQFKDHPLKGALYPSRECHLAFDVVMMYHVSGDDVVFERIGTYSETLRTRA